MKHNLKSGFTLIEFMIVIIIIGLLTAMLVPAFKSVKRKSADRKSEEHKPAESNHPNSSITFIEKSDDGYLKLYYDSERNIYIYLGFGAGLQTVPGPIQTLEDVK